MLDLPCQPEVITMHTHTTATTTSATTVHQILARGVWALPVYAVLLGLSTLTHQPDYTVEFEAYARYVTTDSFLIGHLGASIAGAVIGIAGIVCMAAAMIRQGAASRRTLTGAVLSVAGNVVNAALFGVAAFAQPAIGRAYLDGNDKVVGLNADVYGSELVVTAVPGLLMFIVGAVLLGSACARVARQLRWDGTSYAVTLPLFVVTGFTVPPAQPVIAAALTIVSVGIARRLNPSPAES